MDKARKLGAEIILTVMIMPFAVWIVTSIYSLQARAERADVKIDRAISIEAKVDYIYTYLIEHSAPKKGE